MKKFITSNFQIIILICVLLLLFKSCSDSREISEIKYEIQSIKDSTYTKTQLKLQLEIEGLKSEKRMIQSTDRKILDVNRQTQIDEELKKIDTIK